MSQAENIANFTAIAGVSEKDAKSWLEKSRWNLEVCILCIAGLLMSQNFSFVIISLIFSALPPDRAFWLPLFQTTVPTLVCLCRRPYPDFLTLAVRRTSILKLLKMLKQNNAVKKSA